MKLAPYPEYKDAGVSWVGSIPAHWPEKRAKYYFKEVDERSQTGDEEMLSVSHITGVTPRSQKNVTMFKAESNVGHKRCQTGDLVINTMWAWMSALCFSNHDGIVSPAYGVYRPRSNQDYDNYYLDHLLRIEGYRSEYIFRSTGIRSSRLRLYSDKFLSMPVVCSAGRAADHRTIPEGARPLVPQVHPQQTAAHRTAQGAEAERHQPGRDSRA